jgi:formylglycine-generating enzyme required for sulfatase activity
VNRLRPESAPRRSAFRQEIEARRQGEDRERLRLETIAKKRAEEEARNYEERCAKEEEQETLRKQSLAKNRVPLTVAQERALKPGDSFKEGVDCPEMILVPAGSFVMGAPKGQGNDNERPAHEVTIAKPFAVAKSALTFDE